MQIQDRLTAANRTRELLANFTAAAETLAASKAIECATCTNSTTDCKGWLTPTADSGMCGDCLKDAEVAK